MKNILCALTVAVIIFLTACTKPTEACFIYSPTTVTTTTIVTFNSSCSQNASYFNWSFGDNATDTAITSLTVIHKYSTKGTYNVTLNAKRKDGATLGKDKPTRTQIVTVQ